MKIQFIVGTHPNESYSTKVAEHAARELRKKGIEVIIDKIPFSKTGLGGVLQRGTRIKTDSQFVFRNRLDLTIARALIRKEKPDVIFNFHCTMNPHSHWESGGFITSEGKRDVFDFGIVSKGGVINNPKIQSYVIEIRTQPRMFNSKFLIHLDAIGAPIDSSHFSLSSSLQDTETKLGLNPRIMGREIAKAIINEKLQNRHDEIIMRRIPRRIITPERWEKRNKRRVKLIEALKKRKAARKVI